MQEFKFRTNTNRTSVDVTEVDSSAGGNQTFVITGSKLFNLVEFAVYFVDNNGTEFTA